MITYTNYISHIVQFEVITFYLTTCTGPYATFAFSSKSCSYCFGCTVSYKGMFWLVVFLFFWQKCPHRKPKVKNNMEATTNTVTEEATAIFPSWLSIWDECSMIKFSSYFHHNLVAYYTCGIKSTDIAWVRFPVPHLGAYSCYFKKGLIPITDVCHFHSF